MIGFPRTTDDAQPAWLEDQLKKAIEAASREGLHRLEDGYPGLAAAEVGRAANDRFGASRIEAARARSARANERLVALKATPITTRWANTVGTASQAFQETTSHWRFATSVVGGFAWIGLRDPASNVRAWAALAVGAAVIVVSAPLVIPALRWLAAFATLTLRTLTDAVNLAAAELGTVAAERRLAAEEKRAQDRDEWISAHLDLLLSAYRAQKYVAIHAATVSAAG